MGLLTCWAIRSEELISPKLWHWLKARHELHARPNGHKETRKQLQRALLFLVILCLLQSGCLAPMKEGQGDFYMSVPGDPSSPNLAVARPECCLHTLQHDKWPWKWISAFPTVSLKQAKTHTIAISPSSEFHYTSVSSVLFWQPV